MDSLSSGHQNSLRLRALDVELELAAAGEVGLAELLTRLPATWERSGRRRPAASTLVLTWERNAAGERLLAGGQTLAVAAAGARRAFWLARLEQEIVAAVARQSRHLWLHAGAVLWQGRALVLPGASFAGKSTLVEALLARGAQYLSDEWVAVDGHGQVHALPRALRLREGSARRGREAIGAWPLGATALLRFHPRPAVRPARLAAPAALAAIFAHAIGAGAGGNACGLAAVAAMLRRPVFAGWRGEAESFLDGWLPGQLASEVADAA